MCVEHKGQDNCPWCGEGKESLESSVNNVKEYSRAVEKVNELVMRREDKEKTVIDEDDSDDLLLLANLADKSVESERARLQIIEARLEKERQERLQVSMAEFVRK